MGRMIMTMTKQEATERLWELHCLRSGASKGATRILRALNGGIMEDTAIRMNDIFAMDEYFQPAALELIHRRFMCEFSDLGLPKSRWYAVLERLGVDTSEPNWPENEIILRG